MAASSTQFTTNDNSVSTHVYAPNNSGFTHPSQGQFTYFDSPGTRDDFGLSCDALAKEMAKFTADFLKENNKDIANSTEFSNLFAKLQQVSESISKMAKDLKNGLIYTDVGKMTQKVLDTGHIPVMLSNIAAAAKFERAAQSVTSTDVSIYFNSFPGAKSQASRYCVKTDMMMAIAALREEVVQFRYKTEDSSSNSFILCNRLIIALDNKIIEVNQNSLPKEYEQFDLFKTFADQIFDLTCQLDNTNKKTQDGLIAPIMSKLRSHSVQATFDAQKKLSADLYDILNNYVKKTIGLGNGGNLTLEQDEMLQECLPLIAYLNSIQNPFARNGLFGEEVTNSFHKKALEAYKAHESKQTTGYYQEYTYTHKSSANLEFDEDQIEQLLDGKKLDKNSKKKNQGGLFGKAIADSKERREQLALPAPAKYKNVLMITGPEEVKRPGRP